MILLDANYILRYLLQDNEAMFATAKETILNNPCFVPNEVLAEVVYVLSGVYKVPKDAIASTLIKFAMLNNISLNNEKSDMIKALQLFETKNLDFVDCILCALKKKYTVKSFDKELQKCLS